MYCGRRATYFLADAFSPVSISLSFSSVTPALCVFSYCLLWNMLLENFKRVTKLFSHVEMAHMAILFRIYDSIFFFFFCCSSVHRNSTLKRSNKMQLHADIYLLLNYSTCFRRPSHPSSGVHKTVVVASGTDHTMACKLASQIV